MYVQLFFHINLSIILIPPTGIGKGKKDKLNKIDIVGFLYKKGGMAREDVGQVDVKEHYAFVAVRRSKMKQLLTLVRGEKIKGMKTVIEEAK